MKNYSNFKYTGLALIALAALPACTHGYHDRQESQYPGQENSDTVYSGHKEWKEARLDAMVDHFFEEADTNHDGYISSKEFQAFMHKKFRNADTNHDGKLSRDEVTEMMKRHMGKIHEQMREEKESRNDNSYDTADNQEPASDMENPPRYNPQE